MDTETDRITIVWDQFSYELVTDDGTVLAAGIATRQDAEDRRQEMVRARERAGGGCDACRIIGPLLTAPGTSGRSWRCECGTVWSHPDTEETR